MINNMDIDGGRGSGCDGCQMYVNTHTLELSINLFTCVYRNRTLHDQFKL